MKAQQAANAAIAAVTREPPILYSQEDCQGFIEATVRRAGGSIKDYAGSNDMYRNACTNIMPIGQIPLEPGMVLFIVEHDGGEPDKYKPDGLGNASHVGMYTGGIYEVVHSSATKGKVAASTIKNGWTHAGYLKGLEYNGASEDGTIPYEPPISTAAYINLPADANVFFRIKPSRTSAWWARINGGEPVQLVSVESGWARVLYGEHDGYVDSRFIGYSKPDIVPDIEPNEPTQDVDKAALINEAQGILTRLGDIIKLLGA